MNIFSGCGDGTIGPDRNITRQEAVSVIARAFSPWRTARPPILPRSRTLPPSATGRSPRWPVSVKAGIVSGDAGRLNPTAGITRAEIARMLCELGLQFLLRCRRASGLRPRRLHRHAAPDGGRLHRYALPRRRRRTRPWQPECHRHARRAPHSTRTAPSPPARTVDTIAVAGRGPRPSRAPATFRSRACLLARGCTVSLAADKTGCGV